MNTTRIWTRARSWCGTCSALIVVVLIPTVGLTQAHSESELGERLVHEYEIRLGLGTTPELTRICQYVNDIGTRVANALPSRPKYNFVCDPDPAFKSGFALPGRYVIVGGGLLALAQTEDEVASVLAHEIEHVELGQVSARLARLIKEKGSAKVRVTDFYPSYRKQEELACDLQGQKLEAKAGYSPAGTLTLLESFRALQREPEPVSENHPSLAERIAQASDLAKTAREKQTPLKIP